jgi:hypothetical protein
VAQDAAGPALDAGLVGLEDAAIAAAGDVEYPQGGVGVSLNGHRRGRGNPAPLQTGHRGLQRGHAALEIGLPGGRTRAELAQDLGRDLLDAFVVHERILGRPGRPI